MNVTNTLCWQNDGNVHVLVLYTVPLDAILALDLNPSIRPRRIVLVPNDPKRTAAFVPRVTIKLPLRLGCSVGQQHFRGSVLPLCSAVDDALELVSVAESDPGTQRHEKLGIGVVVFERARTASEWTRRVRSRTRGRARSRIGARRTELRSKLPRKLALHWQVAFVRARVGL